MKVTFYFNSCGIMQSIVLADVLIIGTKAFYAYKVEKIFSEDTITAEGLLEEVIDVLKEGYRVSSFLIEELSSLHECIV